jgi:predicted ribonuclease toxin of YeeF-YezG toxin-antitoxin module
MTAAAVDGDLGAAAKEAAVEAGFIVVGAVIGSIVATPGVGTAAGAVIGKGAHKVYKWGKALYGALRRGADDVPVPSPSTYARPSGYRQGVRDQVWNDAIEASTGRVRDPVTGRFMSRDGPWDMGHKPGYEFRKHQGSAADRGIDRGQFLDEYNDPVHYRPELPRSNRSHRGENVTDEYFGP